MRLGSGMGRGGESALSLAMAPWCCLSLGVANDMEEPKGGEAAIRGACVAEV